MIPVPLTPAALDALETAARRALPRWRLSCVADPPWGLEFGQHCSPGAVLWLIALARTVLSEQQETIERKVSVRKNAAKAKAKPRRRARR